MEYPSDLWQESLTIWFPSVVQNDIDRNVVVPNNIKALLIPLSRHTNFYRSMFASGNHIRVCGAEVDLNTCDSGVAATFLQSCYASNNN